MSEARFFNTPTGYRFQTDAVEVKLSDSEAKALMVAVLKHVGIPDGAGMTVGAYTWAWLNER